MQFLKKKKISFDLYKYKFDSFDNFVSLDSCISNSGAVLVCSFSTEEEFNGVKNCLFGNYIFLRNPDKTVFLYSKNNKYRPFKSVILFKQKKVVIKNVQFPVFQEELKGKVRCVISKKKRNIEIIDEFGKNVNLLMPEVVDAIKKVKCNSLMCEGRIGYTGPDRTNFFDSTGDFFVAISDIFFVNGKDFSGESFVYRKTESDKLLGFSERFFLNEHELVSYPEELCDGPVRQPGVKYGKVSSFFVEKGGK